MKKPYNQGYLSSVAQLAGDRAGSSSCISDVGGWMVQISKFTTLHRSAPATRQQPLVSWAEVTLVFLKWCVFLSSSFF